MRKLKWCGLVPLLMCCAPLARGQCSNGPCYTANPPAVTRLTPAQAAAKNLTTVTINGSPDGKTNLSHNAIAGTGTPFYLNWVTNNASSVCLYYAIDGGARIAWICPAALNGSGWMQTQPSWAGHVVQFSAVATGANTTQDVFNVTVTNQSPGVYSSDNLPENTILHFHASGGGGSMLNDFTMCQGADQQHCINATHTPFTWLTVTNLTQGVSLTNPKHQSGNIAKSNEAVSFGDDMFFSTLPEDIFEYNEGDEVDCSVSGPVGVGPVQMDIRFERAITEEYISSILNSNGMHPEHIYCIIAATPPDFPGADEALPGTPSGQIVNVAFLYREWPKGTQEKGTPWNLVFPDIQEVGIGYYVKTTMEPDPVGCTMWDNGFRHLPLPTPLDPQPQ